jgi:hypothetical protein
MGIQLVKKGTVDRSIAMLTKACHNPILDSLNIFTSTPSYLEAPSPFHYYAYAPSIYKSG